MEMNSLLQGIDTVIVRVSNIGLSKKWYQDQLRMAIIWDDPNAKLAVLDTHGTTSLTLWQTDKKITADKDVASYPIFKTQDVYALREEFLKKGIETEDVVEDDYVSYFFFYDPDGNVLEACQVRE